MKKVVVAGIPLNVISTYDLLETGRKTVLGNADDNGLFQGRQTNFVSRYQREHGR